MCFLSCAYTLWIKMGKNRFFFFSQYQYGTKLAPSRLWACVLHAQKFLQPESDWGLEQDSTRSEKTEKEWGFQKNLQTAESRPVAPNLTETRARVDRKRARATRSRRPLRGPTWIMGDYFPSKQVSESSTDGYGWSKPDFVLEILVRPMSSSATSTSGHSVARGGRFRSN